MELSAAVAHSHFPRDTNTKFEITLHCSRLVYNSISIVEPLQNMCKNATAATYLLHKVRLLSLSFSLHLLVRTEWR